MAKINLQDATSLTNETSFVTLFNENNAELETVGDTFLSLDGSTPNSMGANLDMNSYRIINLPTPTLSNDPVRLQDMVTYSGGGTIASFPTTSVALATLITDETGSGSLVFGASPTITNPTVTTGTFTSPTLVTPVLGAATATTLAITGVQAITATASSAGIELGSTSGSNTPFIDFHSSGNANDHDARIIASGGSASAALGTLSFACAKLAPSTNDGAPLGDTTHNFSDLFLASGSVINWNAGDVTLTHGTDTLAFAGASSTAGYTFDSTFGYPTGAGGTATQSASKTTTVSTLSKPCGEITMNNANLAAGAIASFSVGPLAYAGANDNVILSHVSGGTLGSYTLNGVCSNGNLQIYVRNNTAGGLAEAIVIRYTIIKGAVT